MKKFLSVFLSFVLILTLLPVLPADAAGVLVWPVPGHTHKSRGWVPSVGHYALDITDGSISGATVVAAMGGTVYRKYTCGLNHYPSTVDEMNNLPCKCYGFGNGIVIQGDDGRYYQYAHMLNGSIPGNVYVGQYVSAGAVIGQVGNTGNSDGAHLHFAITTLRGNWEPPYAVDPENEIYDTPGVGIKPIDLGSDFYGLILNTAAWKPIENCYIEGDTPPVRISVENGYATQLWRFIRQSDGSYKIASCYDGKYLDVRGAGTGTNVVIQTCVDTGSDAQKWYICAGGSAYYLKSKLSGYVMDLVNNDTTTGNSLQTFSYNGSNAQIWSIYTGQEVQLSAPSLSVTPGTDRSETGFTWNNVYSEKEYTLKIWKDGISGGSPDYSETTAETSLNIALPAGTYQAYVTAMNHFGQEDGNVVTFTVASSCEHTFGDWEITVPATCTEDGIRTRTCTRNCGHSETEAIDATGHDFSPWIEISAASCTADGLERKTCRNNCGTIEDRTIPAFGHSWKSTGSTPANCLFPAGTSYTCDSCGQGKVEREEMIYSDWAANYPEDAIEGFIESKTQYRYRDRQSSWSDPVQNTVDYVASWPSGFDTSNSHYAYYSKTPVTAGDTDTEKIQIQSNDVAGYLYYHWCRGYAHGPINRRVSNTYTSTYYQFHAFYSTENAGDYDSAGSYGEGAKYCYNDGVCKDSWWYLQIPVYRQTYTTQTRTQAADGWTDWSGWSDTAVSATDDRQVETQTLYRYVTNLGEHTYTDSDKLLCSVCTHFREDEDVDTSRSVDFNRDGVKTEADAVYLLWHTLFPNVYPIPIDGDIDGNSGVNASDAVYLLWHILFEDAHPL